MAGSAVFRTGKQRPAASPAGWSRTPRIAERHAHAARAIRESLHLQEAYTDYHTLSRIAQAQGGAQAAAEWAKKRDDLRAEFQRRALGGGPVRC